MDSFFQFDDILPALGAGKQEEELLTAEIDEDEYDALNDETFGDVAEDEDWEENHERLAELDMKILNQSDDEHDVNNEAAQQSIVEKSISQLGLDDLDDPAIMTYGRSSFMNSPSSKFDPPHLSTSTIRHLEDLENNLRNSSIENQKRMSVHPFSCYDKQPMGISPLSRFASNTWTYDHPRNNVTNENSHWPCKSSSAPSSNAIRTVTDVEKDIFLKPRAQTLDDVEREMHSSRKIPNSPVSSARMVQPPIGTPPQTSSIITSMNLPHSPMTTVPFIRQCSPVLAPPQINPMFRQRFPRMVCQPPMINALSMQFHPPRFLVGKNPAALKLPIGHHNFGSENPSSGMSVPQGLPHMQLPIQYFQQQYQQKWALRQQSNENSKYPVNDGKDSYDGLMTFQEKDWLIKIQMRQLQSDNPYLDDYYYTTFMSKKKAKEKAKNGMNGTGEPKVLLPERIKMESKTYVPTQFEGSLGKLQVASVNNPRKILDVGVCRLGDEEETKSTSTHKFCYTLLSIEKLYTILLEIEDEDKHILALPEAAQLPHQKTRQELIDKLHFGLVKGNCNSTDDNFVHIVSVRKGRNLIMRSLQFFEESNQVALLILLFRCLNTVLRKDQHDLVLLHRCDVVLKIIEKLDLVSVILLAEAIQNVPPPPQGAISGKEKSNYSIAFHTKFGVIVVCGLLKRAEWHYLQNPNIEPDLQKRWASIIMHIVDILCALPENIIVEMPTAIEDIVNHFKRFSIEEDKLGSLIRKFQC